MAINKNRGDDRHYLSKMIDKIHESKPIVNVTVNVYFDQSFLNLYDKKKLIHGSLSALNYLHTTLKNAKPNTKLNWIRDPEIIGQSLSPLTRNTCGSYGVQISPTKILTCDSVQINKISNDIMSNSVIKVINDTLNQYINRFDQLDDEPPDDYFGEVYNGPFGDNI